jgi:hypothetical protein
LNPGICSEVPATRRKSGLEERSNVESEEREERCEEWLEEGSS